MSAEPQDKPTIELYMFSLHQEFPEEVSHDTFLTRKRTKREDVDDSGERRLIHRARDELRRVRPLSDDEEEEPEPPWPAKWLHAKWITDHVKAIKGRTGDPVDRPICMALTREEEFGGVVYDPYSDQVYKVNESGLALFRRLQAAAKRDQPLSEIKDDEISDQDLAEFTAFLRGAGLWS